MGYRKTRGKRGLALSLALLMSLNLLSLSVLAAEESAEIASARAALAEAQADYDAAKANYEAKQADYDAAYAAWQAAQEEPEAAPEEPADPEEAVDDDGEDVHAPSEPAEEDPLAEAVAAAQAALDEAKAVMDAAQVKVDEAQATLDALLAEQDQEDDEEIPPEGEAAPPAGAPGALPAAPGEQAEPQGTELAVPDAPERAAGEREYVLVTADDLVDGKLESGYYAIRASGTTLYCASGNTTVDQCGNSVSVAGSKLTMDDHPDCHVWLILAVDGGYVIQSMGGGNQYFAYGTAGDTNKHFPVSDQPSLFQINYPALDKNGEQVSDRFTISWTQDGQELFINRSSNRWHAYSGGWGVPIELYRERTVAAEPEPKLPEPGEGEMWAYVAYNTASGGDKWGLSENAYTVRIFKVDSENATTGTLVTGAIEEGIYLICAPTVGKGSERLMHNSDTSTNQCGGGSRTEASVNVGSCGTAHMFQISRAATGGWTIKGVTNGKYLNIANVTLGAFAQLPFGEQSAAESFVIKAEDGGFTIAAIVKDPGYVEPSDDPPFKFPEATSGKTVVYQQVTGTEGLLTDGELFAFVDDTLPSGRSEDGLFLYHASGSTSTNHCTANIEGDCVILESQYDKKTQLWSLVQVEGGYKLKNWDSSQYLTATASGNQLVVNSTGSVFTLTKADDGWYVMSDGKYLDFGGNWKMVDTASALKVYTPALVDITGEPARTEFKGTANRPLDTASTSSYYFRIPALTTLDNGWIVAAADIRWRTTGDNANNLDTIVSVSKDGGETWDWEVVNYWGDIAETANSNLSAAFIDPAIVQGTDGKVHMVVDATPSNVGLQVGFRLNGSGFDSQGRLIVAKGTVDADSPRDLASYTYYVDLKSEGQYHPICAGDGIETGYSVDAFLNLYKGEDYAPVMCLQQGTIGKLVQNNLFYLQSEWKAYPTFYIWHRAATVTSDGLEWGDPDLLHVKAEDEGFTGVCPGRGTVTSTGRIVFPLYDNATGNELASIIYSDDNGETWTRGQRTLNLNGTGKSSESQVVRLPDGTLRMYSRNTIPYVSYADSSDGGATWGTSQKDLNVPAVNTWNGCMISFINLDGYLTGPDGQVYENLILASYPRGDGRVNGMVRIGSIGTDLNHTVTWLNGKDDVRYEGNFAYSCITQLYEDSKPSGTFGLLYEESGSNVPFATVTVADLLGEGWTFSLTAPGPNQNVRVTDASGAAIEAVDGLYVIPAGGMVYVDGTLTFTVPLGVKEIRVPAAKAGELALGENGSVALEGMTVVMPDGEESPALVGSGQCGDNVYYALIKDENKSTVKNTYYRIHISGSGPMWDFVLNKYHDDELARPYAAFTSTIRSAKIYNGVTHIGNHAFHQVNLSGGVELPNDGSLKSIGEGAFDSAKVPNAEFALPDGVTTIGREAFRAFGPYPKNAIPFVLPESVTEIGNHAFAYSMVGTITIPGGVGVIPKNAFWNADFLTEVTIQEGVTEIGASAFECANGSKGEVVITLPETLTTIGDRAFRSYKVQRLTIPAGVETIGSDVFYSSLYWLYFKGTPQDIAKDAFKMELEIANKYGNKEIVNIAVIYVADSQVLEKLQGLTIPGRYVFGNLNGHIIKPYWKGSVAVLEEPFRADGAPAVWFTADDTALETRYPSTDKTKPGCTDIPGGVEADPGSVFTARCEHAWSEWTEHISATCTEDGEETRTCGKCGETEAQVIKALGHKLETHEAQAATCTEVGWNAYETCSRCDHTTYAEIAALGHDFTGGAWSSNADGHWHVCAREGCEAEETHAAHAPETIPAVPATYDAPGKTEGLRCSVCGYVITEPQDTPQLTRPDDGGGTGGSTPAPTVPVEIAEPNVPLADLPLPFEDVTDADWYREAVAYVWSNDLMLGTSDNLFGVEANTTRGMMATVLYRLEQEPGVTFEKAFSDVDNDKWFSQAITWANTNGVAVGYDNGSFGPDDNITREQLVTMLYRYALKRGFDVSGKANLNGFSDVDQVNDYAKEAMSWAVAEGIVKGRGADQLAPGSLALRVEVAAIFQRFAARYMDASITA